MVSVLQAPPGSKLYENLLKEGRLLTQASGNNTDGGQPNFRPKMSVEALMQGYRRVVATIYSPRKYYERIKVFLREYDGANNAHRKVGINDVKAFVASVWHIGFFGGWKISYYYWKTLALAVFKHRRAFLEAVTLQVLGMHLQTIAKGINKT
mgnify:CR=1